MGEENESVIVASFPKNAREAICTGINVYKGKNYVFIRTYVPSLNGDLVPTPAGINLNIDKANELIQGIKALEEVMTSEKLVATIEKNGKEQIRIALNIFKDNPLIQIRTYAAYKEGDEYKPTPKGVAMNVNLLPQLLDAVEKLTEAVTLLDKQ